MAATVTLSSKNQITLPVELVRKLKLSPGSKLTVSEVGGHLVLLPEPIDWRTPGPDAGKVWGNTPEETERIIWEDRLDSSRLEWLAEFKALMANDRCARAIAEYLKKSPGNNAFWHELTHQDIPGATPDDLDKALARLEEHGAVRKMKAPKTDKRQEARYSLGLVMIALGAV